LKYWFSNSSDVNRHGLHGGCLFHKPNNLLIFKPLLHVRSPLKKRTLPEPKWRCLWGVHQMINMKNIDENIVARAGGDYVAGAVKALPDR